MYKESYSIHPVLSLICSLLLFITGLLFVKEIWFCNYLITFLILLLIFRFENHPKGHSLCYYIRTVCPL